MIYKNAEKFEVKIGDDIFLFVNDHIQKTTIDNIKKLITFLKKNKIDFEYIEEFKYGIRISIPSKGICSINANDKKDSFYMDYTLENGSSCDWELSFRQLTNYIRRYPNHWARK